LHRRAHSSFPTRRSSDLAGTAISKRSHSISLSALDIKTPTIINAGAVTSDVITANSGEKNKANKKNPAVTTEAKPVLPPTATPEEDSTKDVVVDVPTTEPTTVAAESANNALPARGNLSFFIKPAWLATATNVPALSKKSTNKNVKITNDCGKVGDKLGGVLIISLSPLGVLIMPKIMPTIEVIIIP